MPKIVQYNLPPGGTVIQVADNQVALEIESTDAKDYITIDTTDGSEDITIKGGGNSLVSVYDKGVTITGYGGTTGGSPSDAEDVALYIENGDANSTNACIAELNTDGSSGSQLRFKESDTLKGWIGAISGHVYLNTNTTAGDLIFRGSNAERMRIDSGTGNIGIGTSVPSQILDVNAGSGNMIADGYDTHSLAAYKENIGAVDAGYLSKVTACPPKQWTRKPYVSAEEIKTAAIDQFGQDAWDGYFPEEDSHRAGALLAMPEGEIKTWIDAWADARREERRTEEKWQRMNIGLVADADDTAVSFPESIARKDNGEISGINTMSYIGTLHAAIVELTARVSKLEAGD